MKETGVYPIQFHTVLVYLGLQANGNPDWLNLNV